MFEQNFHLERGKVRLERLFFFFALTSALAILSSCGSSTSTTVKPTISMSCTPSSVTLLGTSQCTANVFNLSSTLVNWSVALKATGTGSPGSITAGGLYTAPTALPMNGTQTENVVTITATSQVQSTLTATQDVTLTTPTAITSVTCLDANSLVATIVASGNQLNCTATASTGAIVPVNWTVTNTNFPKVVTNLGSISTQGVYTATLVPPPGQSITITATSQALATVTKSVMATVVYGNKVLNGSFAFSTSGRLPTNVFWARVGSFSAGGGSLSGVEDTNQGGTPNIVTPQRSFNGSYSIGPDGRGTMQFCEGTSAACPAGANATAYFSIVIISPTQAQMIEFSKPGTSSALTIAGGSMVAQDSSIFSSGNGSLSGTYSFDFSGFSASGIHESIAGEFTANGHGSINAGSSVAPLNPGQLDINSGGVLSQAPIASTTYLVSSNGRGTVTLNGLTFSFYPVSASRVKFIEIDPVSPSTAQSSILLGEAFLQQTSSTCGWALNALSGPTVFQTSGLNASGGFPGVTIGDVGSFTADGTAGNVSAASIDENSGGTVSSALGTLAGNYTMDACGRGTLAIGSHNYIFYIISPSDAVLMETTSGIIAHGFLLPSKGGPFTDTVLTGSYGFRLGGTDAAGAPGNREDFLGQLTSAGTGKGLTGSLDLNDFGATQAGCIPLTTNCVAITNGMYSASSMNNLRATMTLPITTSTPMTRNLVLYMVSPKLFYALDVDPAPAGTAIGLIESQF